jgi:hypothetical protein
MYLSVLLMNGVVQFWVLWGCSRFMQVGMPREWQHVPLSTADECGGAVLGALGVQPVHASGNAPRVAACTYQYC